MLHQKLLANVCIGFLGSCILTFLIILDQALPMPFLPMWVQIEEPSTLLCSSCYRHHFKLAAHFPPLRGWYLYSFVFNEVLQSKVTGFQ
jgi:hypothetical protein